MYKVIEGKKRTITYGQQRLNSGILLQWKSVTKHRMVHYGVLDGHGLYVEYFCSGKTIHHDRANFTSLEEKVTCPYCIESFK